MVVLGKYRVIARLGMGGMAEVFLASATGPGAFNKIAVVKRLLNAMAESENFVQMFLDEAKLSARLSHPNIVQTYEVGDEDGSFFIIMEFLEGQPLNRIFRRAFDRASPSDGISPPVGRTVWVRIAAEALAGLHYAHELCDYDGTGLGIVHRDVTPHNIFVTYDGTVKIVDFGIAKAAFNTTRTETGVFKGKVHYMAPEQALGVGIDRRADIFSLGVTLWELLAGRRLRQGDTVTTLSRLASDPVPRLSTVVSDIPPALDDIIAKATDLDPGKRFATALEMRKELDLYLRTAGDHADADPAAMVTTLFAEERTAVRDQIRAFLKDAAPSDSGRQVPSISDMPPRSFPRLDDGSNSITNQHASSGGGVLGSTSATVPVGDVAMVMALAKASRRKARIGIGVGAAVVISLLAVAASRSGREPEARQSVAAASPASVGVVSVESDPPSATVLIDGRAVGTTPYKAELPIGSHTLAVNKDGFREDLQTITISESPLARSVLLQPDHSHAAPEASSSSGSSASTSAKQKASAPKSAPPRAGPPAKLPPSARPPTSVPSAPPSAAKHDIRIVDEGDVQIIQ